MKLSDIVAAAAQRFDARPLCRASVGAQEELKGGGMSKRLTPDMLRRAMDDVADGCGKQSFAHLTEHIAALEAELAAARVVIQAARELDEDLYCKEHPYFFVHESYAEALSDAIEAFERDYPEPNCEKKEE
jgi:hypothetical protein